MNPRFHVDRPLAPGAAFDLPEGPARHVQVLRLQPGASITLFDGRGGQWQAVIDRMGRHDVHVRLQGQEMLERELPGAITIAVGMPANERMDALVEKATELGAAAIQPLQCERSVLRLQGERAERKARHWTAIAVAACEQSGRNRVPEVAPPLALDDWLPTVHADVRLLLSVSDDASPLTRRAAAVAPTARVVLLSGPEGGFTPAEEKAAQRAGFEAVSLGARVLRADTAPLAALAHLALVAAA